MAIKQYAEQIGITATDEQLEMLKRYIEHKPSVGDVYLLPLKVVGYDGSLDVVAELPDGVKVNFYQHYFTPNRLNPNYPTPKLDLERKFKVGQLTDCGRISEVVIGYRMEGLKRTIIYGDDELELVEETK